jgi:hypothetical protein
MLNISTLTLVNLALKLRNGLSAKMASELADKNFITKKIWRIPACDD